jgi:hypothetical protein
MIKYKLKCVNGHSFESWFSNNQAFDTLLKAKHLECAICYSKEVEKCLMSPSVRTDHSKKESLVSSKGSLEKEILDLKEKLKKSAEDVGKNFSSEARAIHFGEVPERSIYGSATKNEAKELVEEGIPFIPLPWEDKKIELKN